MDPKSTPAGARRNRNEAVDQSHLPHGWCPVPWLSGVRLQRLVRSRHGGRKQREGHEGVGGGGGVRKEPGLSVSLSAHQPQVSLPIQRAMLDR